MGILFFFTVKSVKILIGKEILPRCGELRQGAPRVTNHLCGECVEHFEGLQSLLDKLGIEYRKNPEMVRGLDYYTRTTFEVTTTELGAQSAVAAGGRYNKLVKDFGGPDTPAIGFALGMERLVTLISEKVRPESPRPDAFIASLGAEATAEALLHLLGRAQREHGVETLGDLVRLQAAPPPRRQKPPSEQKLG